jgi:Zn-dependent peptidase ImmA (M78 family)/transcriptional regulator with XRE-family HTH domain
MERFERTRLTIGMRRRTMTQRELADKCDVSPQYVSMVESGSEIPSLDFVSRVAVVLDFPIEFFFSSAVDPIQPEAVSFRSRRGMPSKVRDAGLGAGDLAANVLAVDMEKRYHLPKVDVPDLSLHSPAEAARIMRAHWGLGGEPIENMVHLLESRGVSVFWLMYDNPSLDAVSFWFDVKPFVLLNAVKWSGERARFDAAHELGHLVLHHKLNFLSGRDVEKEAHAFASAFLLPETQFVKTCPKRLDLDELYRLKLYWKVSVSAMIMRAFELGIYSDAQKRQGFQRLNGRGEMKEEKVRFGRENSKLHYMVFEALAKKGIGPADYAKQVRLPTSDVLELMPIGEKFMPALAEKRHGHLRVIRGGAGTIVDSDVNGVDREQRTAKSSSE